MCMEQQTNLQVSNAKVVFSAQMIITICKCFLFNLDHNHDSLIFTQKSNLLTLKLTIYLCEIGYL